jgi:hypothetical protein
VIHIWHKRKPTTGAVTPMVGQTRKEPAMRKNTTLNIQPQRPENLVDFPISDSYRDHYAAQGLTYPSGRCERVPQLNRKGYGNFSDQGQELDAARQEAQGWRSQAIYLEARCANLEEEIQRLQNQTAGRGPNASDYKGVAIDACA